MVEGMKKSLKLLAAVMVLLLLAGCGPKEKRYETSFIGPFDTFTAIVGYAADEETFSVAADIFREELEICHELFDIYNDYDGVSNLKTVNDNAGVAPVAVDGRIIDLLLFAKETYALTDGRVNAAMGSVLVLWHDTRTAGIANPENAVIPPMEELQKAAQHTDIEKLIIDEAAGTVYLNDPAMRLDVGAIAKGFAVQRACDLVRQQTGVRMLVSVGGNVCAVGNKEADGAPWTVGLQDPYGGSEYLHKVRAADTVSVVTSGNYQRYYIVDGIVYHHIIDPETLMPANYFDAVTVMCDDSALGDALSTALFNLPLEEGRALVESVPAAEAMWVKDGQRYYSEGFSSLIKQ